MKMTGAIISKRSQGATVFGASCTVYVKNKTHLTLFVQEWDHPPHHVICPPCNTITVIILHWLHFHCWSSQSCTVHNFSFIAPAVKKWSTL